MRFPVLSPAILSAGVVASTVVAAVVAAPGCGESRPATPEALLAKFAEYNLAGEVGKVWDLWTPDHREREMRAIDGFRDVVRKNPGMRDFVKQFNCSPEELMRLSYVELTRRSNLGHERELVGAKIVAKEPDPTRPDEMVLTIALQGNGRAALRVRKVEDGWGIVDFRPMNR